jgi:hypothetical protein
MAKGTLEKRALRERDLSPLAETVMGGPGRTSRVTDHRRKNKALYPINYLVRIFP